MPPLFEVARSLPPRAAPLRLVALPWAHPTMLAPMEGVTHPELRAIVAEKGGVGIVCTEFVRVSRAPISEAALRRAVVKPPGAPLSVQVMGNDADKMAEAARIVWEAGADVVDVNLGCPMPRIVRKGVGAAMLKDPILLYDVLASMREKVPGMLSAKIRAGFDDAADVVAIAEVVEKAGADFIVVHPRRRADFYDGAADWRIVRTLTRALSIPVVGNGDVWYASDALWLEAETGCAGVMMGRPALRYPWIFAQIAALRAGVPPVCPSGDDVLAFLLDVRGRYERAFGRAIGKMKELVRYLGRALSDDRAFLGKALRASTTDELLVACEAAFGGVPSERLDLGPIRSAEQSRSVLPSVA